MKGIKVVIFNLIFLVGLITFFELLTRKIINFELFYYEMNLSTNNRNYNLHPYGKIPINSNGFYDKEWDSPKIKNRFAYTGDSVVYGVGAGFPNRLTEYLDSFKTDIEHINISKGIGTNILSMGSENEIIDLLKNYNIDKLVYILNLNDISPLAFQSNSKNEYDPKKISKFARLKKFINPLDKKLRGRSTLYSMLRFQFKNFLVLKKGLNISGFKAIELEPVKNENWIDSILLSEENIVMATSFDINSANFFISTSISLIPSAVNFCNLNSNIAFTCNSLKEYKFLFFLSSIR